MAVPVYRYEFGRDAMMEDVEGALLLAVLATQSLHGESQVRLAAAYYFDPKSRICEINANTPIGYDLNRLFVGFLHREFGPGAFRVNHVADGDTKL